MGYFLLRAPKTGPISPAPPFGEPSPVLLWPDSRRKYALVSGTSGFSSPSSWLSGATRFPASVIPRGLFRGCTLLSEHVSYLAVPRPQLHALSPHRRRRWRSFLCFRAHAKPLPPNSWLEDNGFVFLKTRPTSCRWRSVPDISPPVVPRSTTILIPNAGRSNGAFLFSIPTYFGTPRFCARDVPARIFGWRRCFPFLIYGRGSFDDAPKWPTLFHVSLLTKKANKPSFFFLIQASLRSPRKHWSHAPRCPWRGRASPFTPTFFQT